ncbi:MAG: tRNA epoxyqueuosine(34) reductase QueG [Anaerolineaceae bacterium]|nr:tRNA epoxyqueuosine(34) reductase QueG [Anaerolineaceae bacterium]
MTLKDDIQAEAYDLGFSLTGTTQAAPPPHLEVYNRWVDSGLHAEMAFLATERNRSRRADLSQILPDCRTVIVLGVRYPHPASLPQPPASPAHGRVAAYAWGEDYHSVLIPRLETLAARIITLAGKPVRWRAYTDTGPLLERSLSQRAGLGWFGKNTCLISPQHGSFFFLAELLLDIEIDPDEPFTANRCGTCRRCIDACPTACILPDHTINAARCIAYLTIEHRGTIARELRPLLGDRVIGCDGCQAVCPWNARLSASAGDPAFAPRPGIPYPLLGEDILLSVQGFKHKFHNNAALRARSRGYRRNLAVAIGNSRDPDLVPILEQVIHADPEPLVRSHAAWGLGALATAASRRALERARRTEMDQSVREEIDTALENPAR